ncbi:hypothetical protein VTN96DRAFT_6225 [Rasamsonia emersonii]
MTPGFTTMAGQSERSGSDTEVTTTAIDNIRLLSHTRRNHPENDAQGLPRKTLTILVPIILPLSKIQRGWSSR